MSFHGSSQLFATSVFFKENCEISAFFILKAFSSPERKFDRLGANILADGVSGLSRKGGDHDL